MTPGYQAEPRTICLPGYGRGASTPCERSLDLNADCSRGSELTAQHAELASAFAAVVASAGHTPIGGVTLHIERMPGPPTAALFPPSLYIVAQGAKRLLLGEREIVYGGGDLVLMGLDLPALVQVTEASNDAPYLSIEIALDRQVIAAVAAELPQAPQGHGEAFVVGPLPSSVVEPALRLLRLMNNSADVRILADGVVREIIYRVLVSPGGHTLLQLLQAGSALARIAETTAWMHDHLDSPTSIDFLAGRAAMSATSFHREFKSATGTTPVRYHKMLRLHQARRLVVAKSDNLNRIAAAVGYASPSQFSRDYKRAFGSPPALDAKRLG